MDQELLLWAAVALYCKKIKQKKNLMKKRLLKQTTFTNINLSSEISLGHEDWRSNLHMSEESYFELLNLVTPLIKKRDTHMKQSISPHKRLTATLQYLATGMTYEDLKHVTAISAQQLGTIIPETCNAILKCLQGYMKMPENEDDWKKIAKGFEEKWHFPYCLGAIDGKHIRIIPPNYSGSYFLNHEKFYSIVLIACVNANYEFIWCEVGTNGKVSDGEAIKNTSFYEKLVNKDLHIPADESDLPYVFVGGEAFYLRTDFMKPYSQKVLNVERRIFNYRLSKATSTVENVFDIMASRFRIFQQSIKLSLKRLDLVVLTCCILHNFLQKKCSTYVINEPLSNEDNARKRMTPVQISEHYNVETDAKLVRSKFTEYFNGKGKIPWQYDHI